MTLIIAEIGVNHHGRLDHAFQLIRAAHEAGADVAKFQAFTPWKLTTSYEKQAMLKGLALTENELRMCAAQVTSLGIEFMVTPMDEQWLEFCVDELHVRRIKIGSGQANDVAFLQVCAEKELPVIISTGMTERHNLESIIVDVLDGVKDLTVMSCISKYPTPETDIKLSDIAWLRHEYPARKIGLSSHARSFWPCVAAVYAGAQVIEAHIALHNCTSPDASSSLLPEDFAAMVREIRVAEKSRGD